MGQLKPRGIHGITVHLHRAKRVTILPNRHYDYLFCPSSIQDIPSTILCNLTKENIAPSPTRWEGDERTSHPPQLQYIKGASGGTEQKVQAHSGAQDTSVYRREPWTTFMSTAISRPWSLTTRTRTEPRPDSNDFLRRLHRLL